MTLRLATALSKALSGKPYDDKNGAGLSNMSQIRCTSISWTIIFHRVNWSVFCDRTRIFRSKAALVEWVTTPRECTRLARGIV
jgi:hypothetical protein